MFFAVGSFIGSVGKVYWQVLAGRAISGIGGAGMTAPVSIIIADMVPVRDVASWRSYVNIAATTGRSLGGPVGGWLTDTIGWRWSFFGQCPLTLLGLLLILWKLPKHTNKAEEDNQESFAQKAQRVDVAGSIAIAATISAFLLALDFSSKEQAWYFILAASLVFIVLAAVFCGIERRWANEPILPIELIVKCDAYTSYLIAAAQTIAQYSLFYSVPIYFQIAAGTSVAGAGARLVPAVVGNAFGGLLSGLIISKTGRYKHLTSFASIAASVGYVLVLVRWRGATNWPEVLYIFLGGFGMGIVQSTTFIHLAASLEQSEIAFAGTALYLAQNVSVLVGIQVSTTALLARFRIGLEAGLEGVKHKSKIIEEAVSDVRYIWRLPHNIKQIVIRSYVDGLRYTYGTPLIFAVLGLLIGLTLRERKL